MLIPYNLKNMAQSFYWTTVNSLTTWKIKWRYIVVFVIFIQDA